jgi:hypothetical protein
MPTGRSDIDSRAFSFTGETILNGRRKKWPLRSILIHVLAPVMKYLKEVNVAASQKKVTMQCSHLEKSVVICHLAYTQGASDKGAIFEALAGWFVG